MKERFEFASVLGQGGCGKVYRARDRESGQVVALKLLNSRAREEPRLFQRFVREARALARIEHPHVTGVVASDLEGETPWIALELVDGEDLEARLRRDGPFEVGAARALGRQLAEALGELHRHGIIHRDLKPSNLLLRAQDGYLAVTDLGLAALSDATVVTETGELFGTPLYMPPEAVAGKPWTTQGDIYQAGAVLFEVLTGTRLIPGQGMAEVLAAVCEGRHQRFPPGTTVPAALQAVVRKAVAPDPAERYASADALVKALHETRGAAPGHAGEVTEELAALVPGGLGRPTDSSDRGGLPLARWLPVLLLLGAALGFFARELSRTPPPKDVHWQVVGDALVVSYLAPARKDIRLYIGQELLAPDPGPDTGRRRIVFRGLSPTDELGARLVWDGGESTPFPAFAAPPAVRGVAGAAEGGGVLLEAERGCEAWWADAPGVRFRLQKGENPIPLAQPLAETLTLRWEEQGLRFSRDLPRAELLVALADELLESGPVPAWRPILGQRFENRADTSGSNYVVERAPWRRSLPWLPTLLEADLPEQRRSLLWERLVNWQDCIAGERYLRDDPPGLPLPRGRAGSFFTGEPSFPTWRVEMPYEPLDGNNPRKPPNRVFLIPSELQDNPAFGRKSLDYAVRVELTWPAVPASSAAVHCLTIASDRLKAELSFRVRLRGGDEDGDLVFIHPGDLAGRPDKYRGRFTRCYPAAFSPPPGTPVLMTTEELLPGAFEFSGIAGVAVHVPKEE